MKGIPMRIGKFALFAALAGVVSAVLKKQRDRELDEAIWEEPRDV